MANFRDITPEQRKAMRAKSQATRDLRMYARQNATTEPIPAAYYKGKIKYLECKIHQLSDDLNKLSAQAPQEKPVRNFYDVQIEVVRLLGHRVIKLWFDADGPIIELAPPEGVDDPQKDSSLRQTHTTINRRERVLLNAVEETFAVTAEDLK